MKKITKLIAGATLAITTLMGTAGAITLPVEYVGQDPTIVAQINEQTNKQSDAHQMAELARGLGLGEDHDAITAAQDIWAESQSQIEVLQSQLNADRDVNISTAPHTPSGLTAAAFNKILEGTPMAGTGQAFVDIENVYGTNGLFAIGVAGSESTIGRYCYGNNPYGMLSGGGLIQYSSFYDATLAFGKLIASNTYDDLYSVSAINSVYCPGDGGYWTTKVNYYMTSSLGKLQG